MRPSFFAARMSPAAFLVCMLLSFSPLAILPWSQQPVQEAQEIQISAAAQAALKAVMIEDSSTAGSGIPIARIGDKVCILTAKHVAAALKKGFTVRTWDGAYMEVLTMPTVSDAEDLGIFWVRANLDPVTIAPSVRIGQRLMSSGYPMGEGLHLTEGYLGDHAFGLRLMSAPIYFGMSGGPVLDDLGRLVGINKAVAHDPHGIPITMMSVMQEVVPFRDWLAKTIVETLPR